MWCGHTDVIWLWVVIGAVSSHSDVVVLRGSCGVDVVGRGRVSVCLVTTVTAPVVKLVVGEGGALSDGVSDYFIKYVDKRWHVVVCVTGGRDGGGEGSMASRGGCGGGIAIERGIAVGESAVRR